jgi:ribosomal protein S12 methylthiotransferase
MLIAQELTYYGLDIYKKRPAPELLHKLADVKGLEWIRLHYAYPSKFPLEILDVMRESATISANTSICLCNMPATHAESHAPPDHQGRYGRTDQRIREKVPGIAIRTTLIAGFPGETDAGCGRPENFLRNTALTAWASLPIPMKKDTSAHGLEDDVPHEEKERRAQEIMEVQQEISLRRTRRK